LASSSKRQAQHNDEARTRQRTSTDMATHWLSPPALMLFLGSRKIIGLFLASSGTGQPPPPPPSPPATPLFPSSFPLGVCMTGQPPPPPVPSTLASVAGLSVPLDDPTQNQPIFPLSTTSCVEPSRGDLFFVGFDSTLRWEIPDFQKTGFSGVDNPFESRSL